MPKVFKSSLQNRAVGRALALWRRESGLSLAEVGTGAHWSKAKTSTLQNAVVPIPADDVIVLAMVYGISHERRRPVVLGARRARDPRLFDLTTGDAASCVGWTYADVEPEASHVRAVALDVLPPLVQSPEYAVAVRAVQVEEVSEQDHHHYGDDHRERIMRQLADGRMRVDLVLGEAVLRRPVGGALVMADQLLRLAELARHPGVRVRLVPDEAGAFAGMTSFSLLSFREERFDDVVYLDDLHGATWLEDAAAWRPYSATFERLATVALSAHDTAERLIEAAEHLKDSFS